MTQPKDKHMISVIDTIDFDELVVSIEDRLSIEALTIVIISFDNDNMDKYDEMVRALVGIGHTLIGRGSHTYQIE